MVVDSWDSALTQFQSAPNGKRTAAMYTRTGAAQINDMDLRAWLADVPARIADGSATRPAEPLEGSARSTADQAR